MNTMIFIVANMVVIGFMLLINEQLWQRKLIRGEAARKLAHIAIGSFIATWPIYMAYSDIRIALVLGIIGAVVVRHYVVFRSIFDVKRRSLGDIAAPVIILAAAFLEPTKTIFAVTVLHIAFADGLAALIGSRFGRTSTYNIMKQKKSIVGTATFFVASMLIMVCAAIFRTTLDVPAMLIYIVAIPFTATLVENISPRGLDNVFVPAVVISWLLLT